MSNVRFKIVPPLVKKHTAISIPKNVVVVLEPSKASLRSLRDVAAAKSLRELPKDNAPPSIPKAVSIKPNSNQKINHPRRKQSRPKITYQTREPSPGSSKKIKQIQAIGTNKALIIIGNGPSINEVDFSPLKNQPRINTLSINKPDPRLWPTDYWAFFDTSQLNRHKQLWDEYDGLIFNSASIKSQKSSSIQFKNIGGKGFSTDACAGIYIGRSSVYAAMQIALWMNYDQIYIFGCDMNPDGIDGKLHFYGQNPDVNPTIRKSRFKNEAEYYDLAADNMDESIRKRFFFCSEYNPWDFVHRYNYISHRGAVANIIEQFGS